MSEPKHEHSSGCGCACPQHPGACCECLCAVHDVPASEAPAAAPAVENPRSWRQRALRAEALLAANSPYVCARCKRHVPENARLRADLKKYAGLLADAGKEWDERCRFLSEQALREGYEKGLKEGSAERDSLALTLERIAGDEPGMGVHRPCCATGQRIARDALTRPSARKEKP